MNNLTGDVITLPEMSGTVSAPSTLNGSIGAKTISIAGSGGECNVFVGTAGITTFDEFLNAHRQGKACILRKSYDDRYVSDVTYLLWAVHYDYDNNEPEQLEFLCVTPYSVERASIYSYARLEVMYSRSHTFLREDDLPEIPELQAKVILIAYPLEDGSGKYVLVTEGEGVVLFEELAERLGYEIIEVVDPSISKVLRFNSVDNEQEVIVFSHIDAVSTDAGPELHITTLSMGNDSSCTITEETFNNFGETDKESLVQDVIAALPVYSGEVEEA